MSHARRAAPTDVFDSQKTQLKNALEDIDSGRLKLPNFQRSWRWPDSNIVSLIESLAEGHPIGAVMFLETGGGLHFDHRCIEGSERTAGNNASPLQLVMDGQQRLTSLYQVLYSKAPVRLGGDRREYRRLYYMDMRKAAAGDVPLEQAILSVPVSEAGVPTRKGDPEYHIPAYQYANLIFPLNMTFRFREWEEGFDAFWSEMGREERYAANGFMKDYRSGVNDAFTNCMLPIILLRRGMTVQGISRIYEKLNSKGVPLDSFDLLIAQYAASRFDLREDWYGAQEGSGTGRKAHIHAASKGLLADLTPKLFLCAVAMLSGLEEGRSALIASRSELLGLPVQRYIDHRDAATAGFLAAAKFLVRQKIYSPRDLPNMALVTALATVLGHLGRAAESHEVRAKLARWFWCVVYSNSYSNGSEKIMAIDVPEVVRWLLSEPGEAKEPYRVAKAFLVDTKLLHSSRRLSPGLHSAVGTGMMRGGALDFSTGEAISEHVYTDDNYDMHHVFPVKWCRDQGIAPERMDSVVNKTPMSITTNRRIGGRPPSQYIAALEAENRITPEAMDLILRSHGINPEHLRNDDFEAFFAERSQHVLAQVGSEMGKSVARAADAAPDTEEEAPHLPWLEGAEWRMSSRGITGFACIREGRMVVMAGSCMTADANPSLLPTYHAHRERIASSDLSERLDDGTSRLLVDLEAPSASAAASVLAGKIAAPGTWRDRAGRPMPQEVAASLRD